MVEQRRIASCVAAWQDHTVYGTISIRNTDSNSWRNMLRNMLARLAMFWTVVQYESVGRRQHCRPLATESIRCLFPISYMHWLDFTRDSYRTSRSYCCSRAVAPVSNTCISGHIEPHGSRITIIGRIKNLANTKF